MHQFNAIHSIEYDSEGEECELHVYERRYNTRGQLVALRVDTRSEIEPEKDESHRAGFILTRIYGANKSLQSTGLEIRSPYVRKALRDIIKYYPGVNIGSTGMITLYNQPRCLFHYREQLQAYATSCGDPQMKRHLDFCLQYLEQTLKREMSTYNQLVTNFDTLPGLEHKDLWMVYKPGSLLYCGDQDIDGRFVMRLRFLTLQSVLEIRPRWFLECESLECDGKRFGFVPYTSTIEFYDGIKPFIALPTFPLEYHAEKQNIHDQLLSRGKKFVTLAGIHHRQYEGRAVLIRDSSPEEISSDLIKDRIILDCEGFRRNSRVPNWKFMEGSKTFPIDSKDCWDMTDEDILICAPAWALFHVAKIQEVDFNSNALSSLALSGDKKDLIQSLTFTAGNFDPKNEVNGIVLTQNIPESIAEYTRRPLYRLDSGQLTGVPQAIMESRLVNCLTLAHRWGAIVLLDEADVFMQERGLQDLQQNGVISMLLRQLEYYEGILFLTTNRVETIDQAFRSRIHLSIYYPPLSIEHKRDLWRTGLTRANSGRTPRWLTRKLLKRLAKVDVNGREINNIVLIAHGLSQSAKRNMEESDVLRGVDAFELFNNDFTAKGQSESVPNLEEGVK
ncbi:P-loop containing nucleoside triphosphate hydrolase protein [Annulohypoxylon nitens]|nr:P-loop containing nucleoside triphosphate hydrolase protein [Annulohypoxylon nitens]